MDKLSLMRKYVNPNRELDLLIRISEQDNNKKNADFFKEIKKQIAEDNTEDRRLANNRPL